MGTKTTYLIKRLPDGTIRLSFNVPPLPGSPVTNVHHFDLSQVVARELAEALIERTRF